MQNLDSIVKVLVTITLFTVLLALLPVSPFAEIIRTIGDFPYLGYLNWFFPVGRCLQAMTLWLAGIATYYGGQWILRQLGIIGG